MSDRTPDDRAADVPRTPGHRDENAPLTEKTGELVNPPVRPDAPSELGPNTDDGFDANPPVDVDMHRTSDDNDLNPAGSGVSETPLRLEYETIARRDDLARRLEDLVADAREWADEMDTDEAHDLAESLADVFDRLGQPLEDTDETLGNT